MDINYQEIAERAVEYAGKMNIKLDYSKESMEDVDAILGHYYDNLSEYDDEEGSKTLWNIAVHFGIYIGETMLRVHLKEKGYTWFMEEDGLPVLKKDNNNNMSPITKAHKRILYGPEDSVRSFFDVALVVADGNFPTKNVLRVIDMELASGYKEENLPYQKIGHYISLVEEGEEDFIIFHSMDGFLQFYGIGNQFVAEIRVNFNNGDFRTYSIIEKEKESKVNRIKLATPYGEFTPTEREVISLGLLKNAVKEYYYNIDMEDFLDKIPYVDTTEETKRYMGL